jgi:glycosyltransferase involved in cell wall biosynthesis
MGAVMLSILLRVGLVAAPLSLAALFVPVKRHLRSALGTGWAIRRVGLTLLATAGLAVVAGGSLREFGVSGQGQVAGVAGVVATSLAWLPVTHRWTARAHLCWVSGILLVTAYLGVTLRGTLASHLGPLSTAGGLLLWLCELAAMVLSCAYLWEVCEALGTEYWRRRRAPGIVVGSGSGSADGDLPMVSLHVPAHNEPPEMVMDTLRTLEGLDYPRYEIVVIDDNTGDAALWRPVQDWCARHRVKFAHLEDWPGYKSGALNYALRHLTDPRAELIGVVDSDYRIQRGFLRRCVAAFTNPWVGFVQAPQDYRAWRHARYYRRLYYSYKYFFDISQPSRNECDGAIFAGTMGLVRRVALEQLGGWDEWCITEDAELSLRLLRAGWSGLQLEQDWGHGLMPLTFEALKGQRYRWCFGGIQLLRMHWRSLLPGRISKRNRLSAAQRWAYLAGAIQWYGDLLGLVFFGFLLAGAADQAVGGGRMFRLLTPLLVKAVPVLFGLGLLRVVALLRRGTGASWREAVGAFFIWQSTSLVVARASVLGLFARKAAFLRTPKTSEQVQWWHALKANWAETTLALLGTAGIAAALSKPLPYGLLLAGLLLFPTLGLAAAPANSWAAQHASAPPALRIRRTGQSRPDGSARPHRGRRPLLRVAAAGGLVTLLSALIGAGVLLSPGHLGQELHLGIPARNSRPASAQPAPPPGSETAARGARPSGARSGGQLAQRPDGGSAHRPGGRPGAGSGQPPGLTSDLPINLPPQVTSALANLP